MAARPLGRISVDLNVLCVTFCLILYFGIVIPFSTNSSGDCILVWPSYVSDELSCYRVCIFGAFVA